MFFGRNRELREIEDHCDAGRFVVVTAAPGMGLTTLLREGLAPRWQAQGCIVVYFREWQGSEVANDFREAVTAAVCEQADAGFFAQPGTLAEMLERIVFAPGARSRCCSISSKTISGVTSARTSPISSTPNPPTQSRAGKVSS